MIVDESFQGSDEKTGLDLAEACRDLNRMMAGNRRTAIVLMTARRTRDEIKALKPFADFVVSSHLGVEMLIQKVFAILDPCDTDFEVGPILYAVHEYPGGALDPECRSCEWDSARMTFGPKDFFFNSTDENIQTLNILLAHQRGITPLQMENLAWERTFLRELSPEHPLSADLARHRVHKLRAWVHEMASEIAPSYPSTYFVPFVPKGHGRYRLSEACQIIHRPKKRRIV